MRKTPSKVKQASRAGDTWYGDRQLKDYGKGELIVMLEAVLKARDEDIAGGMRAVRKLLEIPAVIKKHPRLSVLR